MTRRVYNIGPYPLIVYVVDGLPEDGWYMVSGPVAAKVDEEYRRQQEAEQQLRELIEWSAQFGRVDDGLLKR